MQLENDPERLEETNDDTEGVPTDSSNNGVSEQCEETNEQIDQGINLLEALMTAQKEAAEYREGWQRERADYSNFRKRSERQHAETRLQVTFTLLQKLLPIFDDLERATQNIPSELDDEAWHDGLALIQRKVKKFLTDNEIEKIDPIGCDFDPKLHEAVSMEETVHYPSNAVTETIQKGYMCRGRIIRPALVRVAK